MIKTTIYTVLHFSLFLEIKMQQDIHLLSTVQVTLLDVNASAGKSLKESLDKQYGREKTLFLSCNVESDEQIKG